MKKHWLVQVPGAVVLAAAAVLLLTAGDAAELAAVAHNYVYLALLVALLLAWRLHCGRLFVAALVLSMAHVALQPWALGVYALAHLLSVTFLPIGIAGVSLSSDDGFTARSLRNNGLLALGPIAAAAFLSAGRGARTIQLLSTDFLEPAYTDWTHLPQLALFACVVAFLIGIVRALRSERAADAGLAWLVPALAFALAAQTASVARGIWVLAGALSLLIALVETAYALAFHDELTGLPSRRALKRVQSALKAPYAIAIVDVDHFKSFNDTHGHDVGDQVLRMVAGRLRAVGGGGQAFRSGGEEFTIVFEGMSKQEALPHMEAVREAVENTGFALRKLPRPKGKRADAQRGRGSAAQKLQVTISVGVAAATARTRDVHAVVKAADKAMYRAKNEGRNCVVA